MGEEIKELSSGEARIMKIIWDGGRVVLIREIIERLKDDCGRNYS